MFTPELIILLATAASIGFFHTVLGPDHYLPFIAMSQSGRWSGKKTAVVTALCGLGHVLSSVALGAVGIALGVAVTKLEFVEAARGGLASWALIAFGLAYFVWGARHAYRGRAHVHEHDHGDGEGHGHPHVHADEHSHLHGQGEGANFTPWVLFTVFVLGPCEPLIPVLMYPAARESTAGVVLAAAVFGLVTVATMLAVVLLSHAGIRRIPAAALGRYSHAVAGATICLSGLAIRVFGL